MERGTVRGELNHFAKTVIKQSRYNLTRQGKKGELWKSLGYELELDLEGFNLKLLANDYGEFVDLGVDGTKVKHGSPFSFTTKQPPTGDILKWVKKKRLRFRDEKGRFIKGSQRSLAFVIARSIKEKGIKPSLFFTKPFKKHFVNIADDLAEAYGLDVEKFIDEIFREYLRTG